MKRILSILSYLLIFILFLNGIKKILLLNYFINQIINRDSQSRGFCDKKFDFHNAGGKWLQQM